MKVIIRFLEWLSNIRPSLSRQIGRPVASKAANDNSVVADDQNDAPDDNIYPLW
jgi:hypothetical protein